jgi:hypothetical protein
VGSCLEISSEWRLTLPTVVARGKAGFSAEELCEMAGVRVANIKRNIHNSLLRPAYLCQALFIYRFSAVLGLPLE